jgi:hypothetical protein
MNMVVVSNLFLSFCFGGKRVVILTRYLLSPSIYHLSTYIIDSVRVRYFENISFENYLI